MKTTNPNANIKADINKLLLPVNEPNNTDEYIPNLTNFPPRNGNF